MREIRKTSAEGAHDTIWDTLPWYVNGTLPADEMDAVKQHAQTCEDCAAEIARLQFLASEIAEAPLDEDARARSWETLRSRIEADQSARSPSRAGPAGLRARFRGFAYGGAALAACLVAAVLVLNPARDDFRTLTSDDQATGALQFQPATTLDKAAIEALLAQQGLTLIAGPSETGVYTASAGEGADLQALAEGLKSSPDILFAAPAE